MDDKKNSNQNSEIDFTSDPSFQKSIKKTKWKQIMLYIVISIITLVVCSVLVYSGSEYLTNKKIQKEEVQQPNIFVEGYQQGAEITSVTMYHHNLFSVVGKTTYYKTIGNRRIVWDTVTKKYPAIGNVEVIDRGSGMSKVTKFNKEANRVVRYNKVNNERMIDFYYPNLRYDFLPQELKIATGLDENTLVEVALSFNEPKTLEELGETLGYKNVTWLWLDKATEKKLERLEEKWDDDTWKVKHGEDAYGFPVSEEHPYTENATDDTTINGAVVSGTPKELKRFQNLELVRTSVIGVTIDKY
ncbi:anti sigma factor C-terminal domain-containing protein [Virgibacillus salinus]|uniref:Sigma factor regulator N-terminal n=1 Tax=Virgibacillus salinus TaxID=553311 RepID=A0A1H0XWV9_9BACI|nr:anti sigma factor C-terminal domain-containing protein [Virgibacillus salinus]SDQ07394.1 Sigma factor regulator N-terminal [Virgibacillus salinus]